MLLDTINRIFKNIGFRAKWKSVTFPKRGYFEFTDNIHFRGTCYIGPDAYWSAKGGIDIGNNVIIGPKSVLWSSSHNYKSMNYIPYGENDEDLLGTITIDDHVWIGLGVTILKGVYIGEGAVIAAQSVVTKNVDAYSIIAGNPAKIIGHRDVELFLRLKKDNKLYLSRNS